MSCLCFRAFAAGFVLHSGLWNCNIVILLSRMIVQTPWLWSEKHKARQCNYNQRTSQFLKQMLTFSFKYLHSFLALAWSGVAGWGGRTPGQTLSQPGDSLIPLNWSSVAWWLKWEPGLTVESVWYSSEGGKLMSKLSLSVAGKQSCVDEAMCLRGFFGVVFCVFLVWFFFFPCKLIM